MIGRAVAAALTLVAADASAYPVHRRLAKLTYQKSAPCEMCHSAGGGTERNAYGKDWQKRGEGQAAFKKIEGLDSDGDGKKNVDEIMAGSNPGDAASTPETPGRYAKLAARVPVPTEQLELVMERVDSVEVLEPDLTSDQLGRIGKESGATLAVPDQYPTLYFGVVEGKKTQVALFQTFKVDGALFSLLIDVGTDGKIKKAALFRAGNDTGVAFRPYLNCLTGLGKTELAGRDVIECGTAADVMSKQRGAVKAMTSSIRAALWTVAVLFGS